MEVRGHYPDLRPQMYRETYRSAIRPNNGRSGSDILNRNPSLRKCVLCHTPIAFNDLLLTGINSPFQNTTGCMCRCCVYCSRSCQMQDANIHIMRCTKKILDMEYDISRKVDGFMNIYPYYPGLEDFLHDAMFRDGDGFPINTSQLLTEKSKRDLLSEQRSEYFNTRDNLLKELIHEGFARGHRNELALEIAINHGKDLLVLRRDPEQLHSIYLFTGRLQELYDLSCCYMKHGYYTPYQKVNDTRVFAMTWSNNLPQKDITKSHFKRSQGDESYLVNTNIPEMSAPLHMFLVKYLLHMSLTNLILINENFLDNHDCMELIGEYAGMKKEWIVQNRELYLDHAFEVIRHCSCSERYYMGLHLGETENGFDKIKQFALDFIPGGLPSTIEAAIDVGTKWLDDMEESDCYPELVYLKSRKKLVDIVRAYQAEHSLVYELNIRPAIPLAVKTINAMAEHEVFGPNIDHILSLSITEFVKNGTKACHNRDKFFDDLFEVMDPHTAVDEAVLRDIANDEADFENIIEFRRNIAGQFSSGILSCLLIERNLAHCYYHLNKDCPRAKLILDKIPQVEYCKGEMWYKNDKDSYLHKNDLIGSVTLSNSWASGLTKLVDALFEANLSSDANLTLLCGSSGYVSYRIWELEEKKAHHYQRSIESFITRSRVWQEGCIDINSCSGLKIKYLTKMERRKKFEESRKLNPLANSILNLEPSIEQFVDKFGWEELGITERELHIHYLPYDNLVCHEFAKPVAKKPRYELDRFQTVEEACRHYFDTASLEEAILDLTGILRLLILNGDTGTMQESGWTFCRGNESARGDKSVKLGSRVAHAIHDGWCTLWTEN